MASAAVVVTTVAGASVGTVAQIAVPVQFPFVFILVAFLLLIVVMRAATANKRNSLGADQRLCRGCGTSHPSFAAFCRRCGRRL